MTYPQMSRRTFQLGLCALPLAIARVAHSASQPFPDGPIKYIIGSGAGSSGDTAMRVILHEMGQLIGAPFVVENRSGAGGIIALDAVVNATPNGQTLGHGNTPMLAILPGISKRAASGASRITPIAPVGFVSSLLSVRSGLEVNSVAELIKYAKEKPGKLTYGAAMGTTGHVGMELFKKMTGTDILHVPYKAPPPALNDLLAGQIDIVMDNVASSLEFAKTKKMKTLAITSRERSQLLPEIPPVSATVPGFESVAFTGVMGPAGMDTAVVAKINAAVNEALKKPNVVKLMSELGYELRPGTPQQYAETVAAERRKWSAIVKETGVTMD